MIGAYVFEHEDLQQLAGHTRQADLEAWLKRNKIRYGMRRTGFWTTQAALDEALGVVKPAANDTAPYNVDDVL